MKGSIVFFKTEEITDPIEKFLQEINKSAQCLIAKKGSNLPNCHEKSIDDCDVKKLVALVHIYRVSPNTGNSASCGDCEFNYELFNKGEQKALEIVNS